MSRLRWYAVALRQGNDMDVVGPEGAAAALCYFF